MADVIKQAPFGDYETADNGTKVKANIDKMIALFTPSDAGAEKAMANPYFAMPSLPVCEMIITELKAIKDKTTVA